MPIYEYQCKSCGWRGEVLQRMSDPPLSTCEQCGGELKKLISAPAFQFKGTGWYVTDYANKGKGGEKSADSGSGAESGSGEGKAKKDSSGGSKPASSDGGSKPAKSD